MSVKSHSALRTAFYAILMMATTLFNLAQAQDASAPTGVAIDQLRALLPDAQELSGFAPIRPVHIWPNAKPGEIAPDGIKVNAIHQMLDGRKLGFSLAARHWYSYSEMHSVEMRVRVYSSAEAAHDAIMDDFTNTQGAYKPGAYSGSPLGNESWFYYGPRPSNGLVFRYGKAVVTVRGSLTFTASKQGGHEPFPMSSVEAIGNTILIRLARQPELTGVPAQTTQVAVNGNTIPARSALLIGKQLYVPVTEFAKAAGWKSQWDAKTGALTLTNPANKQPIVLAAGSTAVSEKGKVRPVSLQSAVLKEANQPVMLLDDLLKLTKGRIANRTGNSFLITV